jgi:hypothetical protein
MRRLAWILVLCTLSPAVRAQDAKREWKYANGQTLVAQFVREVDGEALLLKDGKPLTVPLEQLSEADRQYIAKLQAPKSADEQKAAADNPFQPVSPPREAGGQNPFREVAPPKATAPLALAPAQPLVKPKTKVVDRDWSDTQGNRTFGKFVRVVNRTVVIVRGTRLISVPFDTLSRIDQDYINQVLEERGELPMMPLPGSDRGSPPPVGGEDLRGPAVEGGQPVDNSPLSRGNNPFFDELRQKQEERRQEQADFAQSPEASAAASTDAESPAETPQPPNVPGVDARDSSDLTHGNAKPAKRSGALVIDAKTMAELRPVIIMGGIVIGLIAAVAVIVFIATSLAASNSPKQRRYL